MSLLTSVRSAVPLRGTPCKSISCLPGRRRASRESGGPVVGSASQFHRRFNSRAIRGHIRTGVPVPTGVLPGDDHDVTVGSNVLTEGRRAARWSSGRSRPPRPPGARGSAGLATNLKLQPRVMILLELTGDLPLERVVLLPLWSMLLRYTPRSSASCVQFVTAMSAGAMVSGHCWSKRFTHALRRPAARDASTSSTGSSPT